MQVYNMDIKDIKSNNSRRYEYYFPRVCLSYFLRKYSKASLHQIARNTGRDHATVMNHLKQVDGLHAYPEFKEKFINIEKIISKRLA